MKTLYIIASPRGEMSKSIDLGNHLVDKIGGEVITLDVNKEKVPYISFPVVAMNYGFAKYEDLSQEDKAIADLQAKYIETLKSVDNIVIAAPMWNFGMPAALKSWFDLVIKINDTFSMENGNYSGHVDNIRKAAIVGARGGKYIGTQAEGYDQLTPQINGLLGFMGIRNAANFWLEGVNMSTEEELSSNIAELKSEMNAFAA